MLNIRIKMNLSYCGLMGSSLIQWLPLQGLIIFSSGRVTKHIYFRLNNLLFANISIKV